MPTPKSPWGTKSAEGGNPDGLTKLERAVMRGVFAGHTMTDAMRKARPESKGNRKTLATEAARIMKRPHVAAAIKRLRDRAARSASVDFERVLLAHSAVAFSSLKDIIDEQGRPRFDINTLTDEQAAAYGFEFTIEPPPVTQTEAVEGGPTAFTGSIPRKLKIRSLDKQKALEEISALMGWGEKNQKVPLGRDKPVSDQVEALEISDEEKVRRVAFALRKVLDIPVIEGGAVEGGEVIEGDAVSASADQGIENSEGEESHG